MKKIIYVSIIIFHFCYSCKNSDLSYLNQYGTELSFTSDNIKNGKVKNNFFINVSNLEDYQLCSVHDLNSKVNIAQYKLNKKDYNKKLFDCSFDTLLVQNKYQSIVNYAKNDFITDTFKVFKDWSIPYHQMLYFEGKFYYSNSVYGWLIMNRFNDEKVNSHSLYDVSSNKISKFYFDNKNFCFATHAENDTSIILTKLSIEDSEIIWKSRISNTSETTGDLLSMNLLKSDKTILLSYGNILIEADLRNGKILNNFRLEGNGLRIVNHQNSLLVFSQQGSLVNIYEIKGEKWDKINSININSSELSKVYCVKNKIFIVSGWNIFSLDDSNYNIDNVVKLNHSSWGDIGFYTDFITNEDHLLISK